MHSSTRVGSSPLLTERHLRGQFWCLWSCAEKPVLFGSRQGRLCSGYQLRSGFGVDTLAWEKGTIAGQVSQKKLWEAQ